MSSHHKWTVFLALLCTVSVLCILGCIIALSPSPGATAGPPCHNIYGSHSSYSKEDVISCPDSHQTL